jgi:hypothetical protein
MKQWMKNQRFINLAKIRVMNNRKRMILTNWKMVVDNIKQDEILLLKIIINRWWMHTQDMLDRRRVRKVTYNYWVERRLKSCFSKWRSISEDKRLRVKSSSFGDRRLGPSTALDTMFRYNKGLSLRGATNAGRLFTDYPTIRYSSVPRMRLEKSSIDYFDDIRRPRAISRSLSPTCHYRRTFQSNQFSTMPNYKHSQKSFTLLDKVSTPSWVLNAMSNARLRFNRNDTTDNVHHRPFSREKYAEPKTYNEFDTFTAPRLNETVSGSYKESKLRHQYSKPITYGPSFDDKEYKRYY